MSASERGKEAGGLSRQVRRRMFSRASRTVTSLSRLPFLTYRSGMKVMLLNDTSLSPHVGCLAVSAALERLISLAGTEITQRVYVTEQRELWRGTAADSIRTRGAITDFGRTLEGRRRDFRRCIRSSRRIHLRLWTLSMTKNGNSISHRLKKDQPRLPRTNVTWTLHNGAVRRMIRTSAQSNHLTLRSTQLNAGSREEGLH